MGRTAKTRVDHRPVLRAHAHDHLAVVNVKTSPFQQQYEWEIEFATAQPDGVTCQIPDCTGHTNWGWCSLHTPMHYNELP